MLSLFADLLPLLRWRQWTKNLICLGGAFFAGHMLDPHSALRACLATGAFCAAASFVYIINDILDRDRDRKHPRKRFRPIASGRVTVPQALWFAVVMLAIATGIGATLGPVVLAILACYALLNIGYSAVLKNLSLVDATVVATGFILRIFAGTVAVGVAPSAWLLLCTLFASLFLAFGKRRAELNSAVRNLSSSRPLVEDSESPNADFTATRAVLHKYNVPMLDRFCNICATLTIATYAIFTVLGHPTNRTFVITTPPVVMGIFRYILLIERYHEGEAPEAILFSDWGIQLAIVTWAALYAAVLYFHLQIDLL
jgi:4-hydroxybenzoate polyprenyltransferase